MILNILILGSRGIPARYGGFETYVDKLSTGLVQSGHSVTVFNPHHHKVKGQIYNGVRIKYVFDPEIYFKNRVIKAACTIIFDFLCFLRAFINKQDVILLCGYASGPLMILNKFSSKIFIVNPDGFEWKSSRWGKLAKKWLEFSERMSYLISDGIIADSLAIKEYFQNKYPIKNIISIPYGAELYESLDPLKEWSKDEYYLAIARMVPETSIPMIIDGFLNSNSLKKLLIVGPIKDKKFFEEEVLPKIDNIKVLYLGCIYEYMVVPRLRNNSFCLLHGHASDGTNPSLIESMGCKSCVLAIDRKSNRIPLTNHYDVYFKDSEELSKKINWLETISYEKRLEIKEFNYEQIKNNFSWDKAISKHINFFKLLK
tara:strand:+ start:6446 stop:7558 length:1113 start_codon:yes stop_codon:yes gene_type:complete